MRSAAIDRALDECWQKAKADDDVWSIILTGTADAFCVGGDLKENLAFAKGEMKGPRSGPRGYSSLRPLQMHKPIIAAINGYAVGGGFSLALSCHIRYCAPVLNSAALKYAGRTWLHGRAMFANCRRAGLIGSL